MVYTLVRFVATSVLPDVVTHLLVPPNTPAYSARRRYTFSLVILLFLLYNLIQGLRSVNSNFYQLLRVSPDVEEHNLKVAFRQFAKRYHPDKVGSEGGEEAFMLARDAFEALKNPVVRFAYDRFGPDVLTWTQCTTTKEYVYRGLLQSSAYHIVTGVALLFWSAIGEPSPVAFWRYLIFMTFLALELSLMIRPPSLVHSLFPHWVPYQHVIFLRQLFMFLSIALSRIAPKLFPEEPKPVQVLAERVRALAAFTDRESSVMLHTELHSIRPQNVSSPRVRFAQMKPCSPVPDVVMEVLTREMENMVMEGSLMKEVGPLKSVWEGAVSSGMRSRSLRRSSW